MPELLPGEDEIYVRAFWDLSSERQVSGGVVGRIPWGRTRQYARAIGIRSDMLDAFWRVISAMDEGYLEWMRSEYDRNVKRHAPAKAPGGRERTTKGFSRPRRTS